MSKCRECGASIAFVRMADTGKLMPCNPGADPDRGNVACIKSGALYINGYVITDARPLHPDFTPLLAHWRNTRSANSPPSALPNPAFLPRKTRQAVA